MLEDNPKMLGVHNLNQSALSLTLMSATEQTNQNLQLLQKELLLLHQNLVILDFNGINDNVKFQVSQCYN
jgi:hypothetical protein